MQRSRKPVSPAKKQEALSMLGTASHATIARTVGVDRSTLHRWIKKAGVEKTPGPALVSDETATLRARVRELEKENGVLRLAVGYVSRAGQ